MNVILVLWLPYGLNRGKGGNYVKFTFVCISYYLMLQVFQFLASIGGALGLWIGLSLLSFCEIMQLLGDVLLYLIEHCRHAGHYNNRVKT